MTICWIVIDTPTWFCFESALNTVEFIFEAINCRPDGKRPSIQCLTACFFAMFGEYARLLQNEGVSLEAWTKDKVNWRHYWSESIVSVDAPDSRGVSRASPLDMAVAIPNDLVSMVKGNAS